MQINKKPNIKDRIINDPNEVLTLSNFISLLRAFSAIPIIYSLAYPEWNWITGILILFAVLSDALDGYFARRAGSVTHFGKWIDPAADFIVIVSVLVYLVGVGRFPAWFFYFLYTQTYGYCGVCHLLRELWIHDITFKLVGGNGQLE